MACHLIVANPKFRFWGVHGQLIRRLRDPLFMAEVTGAGSLLWRWDGLDERGQTVPSGMYLVAATVGDQRYTGKLIKLR